MICSDSQILTANGYVKAIYCSTMENLYIYNSKGRIVKAKLVPITNENKKLVKIITSHGDITCEENQLFKTVDDLDISAKNLEGEEIFQFYFPKIGVKVLKVKPHNAKRIYEVYFQKEDSEEEDYFIVNGFCMKGKKYESIA